MLEQYPIKNDDATHFRHKSFSFLHFNSQKIHQSPQRLVHRFGLCQLRLLLCLLRGLRGGTKLRRLWIWKWVNKRSNRKSPKDSVVGLPNDLFMAYTRGDVDSLKTLKLAPFGWFRPLLPFPLHPQRDMARIWTSQF